ncbi:MAG: MerR family transcriptional regulator [Faecalicatena sp.]|uniref:MerR family transcriptional regulator n=1 Tax=Faecalicatena sp. TaxID=2005360 RepID=UPI00258871FC|nr:MerR family transcriptional regulator [Faecalicatena sp.]MCI6466054.1 MerR family transcriptional regulator [Faecalicatena sp.]MDY5621084.1 MerR family transcriptional regulator [Lachnospiraceae bacterium]
MNIKEVEKEVGIRKANIRYYEEQGLITPQRNSENNYRDYCGEDIKCLKKIKALRLLGISVSEIKALQAGGESLTEAISKRILEIEDEMSGLGELKEMCQIFLKLNQTYETLDPTLLDTRESLSFKKGATFMRTDRSRNYEEAYHRSTKILTFYVLLVMLPTSSNLQNLLHYSLPDWMRMLGIAGTLLAGIAGLIFYILMYRQKRREREESEIDLSIRASQH